jgi:hypothetical protein
MSEPFRLLDVRQFDERPYTGMHHTSHCTARYAEQRVVTNTPMQPTKIPLMSDSNHLNQFVASLVVRRLVEKGELR